MTDAMAVLSIVAVVVGVPAAFVYGAWVGFNWGQDDAERRWSDAVGRTCTCRSRLP